MKMATSFHWLLAVTVATAAVDVGAQTPGPEIQRAGGVTFVQWTDLHLFDAGATRHGEGVLEEALDNRAALSWAVLETNRLRLVVPQLIDFVVISGDLGLSNVLYPHTNPSTKPCECPLFRRGGDGPVPPVTLAAAASELGQYLDALLVKRVYLVPGEADLCREDARDLHRWADFVTAVRDNLADRRRVRSELMTTVASKQHEPWTFDAPEVIDLTGTAELIARFGDPRVARPARAPRSALARAPVVVNGITLIGLNSAYFRPHDDDTVQRAADEAIADEMDSISGSLRNGGSYLLFTHVPDVAEPPYELLESTVPRKREPDTGSAWRLAGASGARRTWSDSVLGRNELIGVFAGHFHTAIREGYPQGFTWQKETAGRRSLVARKTWVAPPLANTMQWTPAGQKTARGMLLVTVTNNGAIRLSGDSDPAIDVKPVWFATLDQKTAAQGDDKIAQARALELDGALDAAAATFAEALQSTDAATRATASAGLTRTRGAIRSWWWQLGTVVPPVRWAVVLWRGSPLTLLGSIERTLAGVFLGLLALAPVLAVRRRWGRATLLKTEELTKDAPTAWLSQEIMQAQEEIKWRLQREKDLHQAGGRLGTFVMSASRADLESVTLPSVQGVDVKGLATFFLSVWRYLGWKVQPALAVRGTRLSVFATRRWAWRGEGAWQEVRTLSQPAADQEPDLSKELPIAARRIAARIMGVSYTRRRRLWQR